MWTTEREGGGVSEFVCLFLAKRKMWIFSRKGPSGFSASSTAEEVTKGIDGTGLTAIVTGLFLFNFSLSGCSLISLYSNSAHFNIFQFSH